MSRALVRRASKSLENYVTVNRISQSCKSQSRIVTLHPRHFTSTAIVAKKKRNVSNTDATNEESSKSSAKTATTSTDAQEEAFDFSSMERKILKAIEHMTHKLAELKSGGAFNTSALENLSVQPSKDSQDVSKLNDLAQVVIKGRHINVILSDEAHIKPVKSAIQSSNLSLTPQGPTEADPTTLVINLPPPTGESRQAALDSATKLQNAALDQIREARAGKNKKLRAMQIAKTVKPDQIQKAIKEMEAIVQRFSSEVKAISDTHRQVISR